MATTIDSGGVPETDYFFVREGVDNDPLRCEPVIHDMVLIGRLGQPSLGLELDSRIGIEEVRLDAITCSRIASTLGKNAMQLIGNLRSRESVRELFDSIKWFKRVKDPKDVVTVVELPVKRS